jgi:hypothetical protein
MSTSAETSSGSIVCPFVAQFDADSRLNVEANTSEVVTIGNIDHTITVTAADLASAFDCSGWGVNKLLDVNQLLVSELVVSLTGTAGSNLKGILATAVNDGQLNTYLRGQYTTAFNAAFPDYVSTQNDVSGANVGAANGNTGVAGLLGGTANVVDASANTTLSASIVTQTATVYSYEFAIDISGGEAAAAMYAGLTDETNGKARLNSLFLQLPYTTNIVAHTDASGAKTDSKLPLLAANNDTITFVFDINVTASTDPDSGSGAANINGAAAGTNNPGTAIGTEHSIQMDLGSRRVAFVIPQSA